MMKIHNMFNWRAYFSLNSFYKKLMLIWIVSGGKCWSRPTFWFYNNVILSLVMWSTTVKSWSSACALRLFRSCEIGPTHYKVEAKNFCTFVKYNSLLNEAYMVCEKMSLLNFVPTTPNQRANKMFKSSHLKIIGQILKGSVIVKRLHISLLNR